MVSSAIMTSALSMALCMVILATAITSAVAGNGNWGTWSDWSACDEEDPCAVQERIRQCLNPIRPCEGLNYQTSFCYEQAGSHCPVDGGWSDWSAWTTCSTPCGTRSLITRRRYCTNPLPRNGGATCRGQLLEVRVCTPECTSS